MLNPTDYAAYSRATGRPYPENEEERAQMYGEVRNFRNNQLKNQDKNNIGENIAIGALGLGGLALGTAAGRRAMANRKAQKAASGAGGRRGGVGFQDNPPATPKDPSGGGGSGGILADLPSVTRRGAYDRAAAVTPDPGVGKDVQYRNPGSGGTDLSMLIVDEGTGEIYRRGGGQSIRSQQARDAIKDVNNRVDRLLADVSVGEAGEMLAGPEVAAETRQMTGTESSRQSAAVRRQEKQEESLAKNILSELAAETPAQMSELSPREQAFYNSLETDESRSRYLKEVKTRFKDPTLTETYEEFGEPAARIQNIDALNTAADQAAAPIERELQRNEDVDVGMAQRFLNNKREKLEGQGLSPTRVERVLASDPATAEAAELYASTGDESVLSRFSEQPASPVAVKAKGSSRLEEIPTKELYRKAPFGEFVDDLEGKDIELTNRISSLGAEQQELVGRRKQLEEDSLMIRSAMDREKPGQDSYSQIYGKMQYEMQNMPDPASLNVDIGDAMAERENVRAQLKGLKEVGPQQFLADVTEGLRVGYQVDPKTEQVIPGTEQTRSYLKPIEQTKAGGGRRVAEFTAGQREPDVVRKVGGVRMRNYDEAGNQRTAFEGDRTVQAKKTVYGLQTPDEVISEGLRPSRIPQSSVVEEGLRQSVAAPEGDVPIPPPEEVLFVREKPQRSQDPLKASEAIRRARIEGDRRDPQAILRAMGFGV